MSILKRLFSLMAVLFFGGVALAFYLINDNTLFIPLASEKEVKEKALSCVQEMVIETKNNYSGFNGLKTSDLIFQKVAFPSPYDDQLLTVFFEWKKHTETQILTVDLERRYYFFSESYVCFFPRFKDKRIPQKPRSSGQKIALWLCLIAGTVYILKNKDLFLNQDSHGEGNE